MKSNSFISIINLIFLGSIGLIWIYYLEESGLEKWFFPSLNLPEFIKAHKTYYPYFFLISQIFYRYFNYNPLNNSLITKPKPIFRFIFLIVGGLLIIFGYKFKSIPFIFIYPLGIFLVHFLPRSFKSKSLQELPTNDIKIKTETRKIENDSSFHWKTENGIINIVNPFQGILIVGGAGSGKTYTLIQEIIVQSLKKGFTGFIYDYKFPELTNFTYDSLLQSSSPVKFYAVNFIEPEKSHRINPLHPRNLPISLFANEYATVILKNLKKEWVNKQDFWADNAIAYFKAIIWFLRKHEPYYCTLPHAIALALKDYSWVIEILNEDLECRTMIASLWTAYQENAQNQIAGCISSLQNPLEKLNNPEIFWILTGDEAPLNLNNPDHPSLLCIGNSASIQESLNPIISLIASVVIKNLNQKGKEKSIFLLDEAPTLYIPNLKDLPNTGRSNRVSTIFCCQDFSQMEFMYGREESKVLRASLGNQFYGMVNDYDTSLQISNLFGKENEINQSKTLSSSYSDSQEAQSSLGYSYSFSQKEVLKTNAALHFQPGFFVGKLTASQKPLFAGKPIIATKKEINPLAQFRIFPDYNSLIPKNSSNIISHQKLESNLWTAQQNSVETVINWNYRKVFLEVDDILFRHTR